MDKGKILVLGATGAMAVYLIPKLIKKGYKVVGVSLDEVKSEDENLVYIKADAKDLSFLREQINQKYDAIVDFMVYTSIDEFEKYINLFLENTKHYIFFSTYRVYADDSPLSETSKRLLDIEKPQNFVSEFEYSIYKAEEEDWLNRSPYNNYTIVRPAITYSKRRFQLTILEADVLIYRMMRGKTVVLPESAMDKEATMSWAGDVAEMLSSIILNCKAYGETYNVATSEHMKWSDIAKIYQEIGGLKYITVDDETFLDIIAEGAVYARQQLLYDRCYNRVVDNKKILSLSGMKQEELMHLKDGLKKELLGLSINDIGGNLAVNTRMDKYLKSIGE